MFIKRSIVLSLLLLSYTVTYAEQESLALVGATVVTATGEAPIADAVILISEGQIQQVGTQSSVAIPDAYRQIDVTGKWITPGLIDSNIHLILMTVPEFFIKYEDRLAEIAIQSAQVGLKYGLTTMPDTWGPLKPWIGSIQANLLVAGC